MFAAKIMSRIGRKNGFIFSSFYSSVAALLAAYAIYAENFILFVLLVLLLVQELLLLINTGLQQPETVHKNDSSRAISILLLATILSALIGPNIANLTRLFADHLYTGSYVSLAILIIIPVFFYYFINRSESKSC